MVVGGFWSTEINFWPISTHEGSISVSDIVLVHFQGPHGGPPEVFQSPSIPSEVIPDFRLEVLHQTKTFGILMFLILIQKLIILRHFQQLWENPWPSFLWTLTVILGNDDVWRLVWRLGFWSDLPTWMSNHGYHFWMYFLFSCSSVFLFLLLLICFVKRFPPYLVCTALWSLLSRIFRS